MPIETLEEPVWEKQKGETPNQYCYFQEFLKYPTFNLKTFHQHLCDQYQKVLDSNDKAKIPKLQTIRNWSSCNKWTIRKEARRVAEDTEILQQLHEMDKEQKARTFQAKQEIEEKLLDKIIEAIELGQPLSQINQGIQGLKTINEDKQLTQEKPTNYNKTDIDAETKVQHQGVNEIVEAFYVSKTEWDKRKQE